MCLPDCATLGNCNRIAASGFAGYPIIFPLSPINFLICGAISVLIVEQRISSVEVGNILHLVNNKTLTRSRSLSTRDGIELRDRKSSLNLLFVAAVYNHFIVVLIIPTVKSLHLTPLGYVGLISFLISNFRKATIALFSVLYEMCTVNETAWLNTILLVTIGLKEHLILVEEVKLLRRSQIRI